MIFLIFSNFYIIQGDITNFMKYNGINFVEHKYLTVGNHEFISPKRSLKISFLIVGGGGGGGSRHAGGGGGGGVVFGNDILISPGTFNITVGNGGLGGYHPTSGVGGNGGDSSFLNLTALGGGGGGCGSLTAKNGGSGGGAGGKSVPGISLNPSTPNVTYYGNKGGNDITGSSDCTYAHGGGGGAGGIGQDAYSSPTYGGGNGGPGIQWIDGIFYGGEIGRAHV